MPYKTYHGSCHCKAVTFEADVDLADGTGKCNCTWCWKHRYWSLSVPPERFRALAGEELLLWGFGPAACPKCHTLTYARVPVNEWNTEARVSISLACFDDLGPADLIAAPVTYYDGLHDNWWNPPAETRHL